MGNRSDSLTRWSGRSLAACVIALFLGLTGQEALAQDPASTCTPAVGRIVSLQGSVELQRASGKSWEEVKRLDTSICAGDRLRTGAMSRALLFVQPETIVRVDQNTAITLHLADEVIEIEFFASELAAQLTGTQTRGAGYFITRFPKKFKVVTPHMNAAVEGTEFMVELSSDATKLTVIEGKVSSESVATRDTQVVTAGQSIASGAAGPGAIVAVIKPQDAVQWVLRYPPLSDGASSSTRAEELLQAGSVDAALAAIDKILASDPGNAESLALRAVIQIAKNDKAGALESAQQATVVGRESYRAWLALSYAEQAAFDLEAALESARRAETLQASSAIAHARLAELRLSLNDIPGAELSARAAIASNPAESHAHSILGFVNLAQVDTKSARSEFSVAIDHDSFSALARLGLGLAMIRDGELNAGREQLEIAVALDPTNSLIRSYVGKAYYEENTAARDELAATQFDLARRLDPNDPTPWFYASILNDSLSLPAQSLRDLARSTELNGDRSVYRSRQLLDQDLAARSASQARVYNELGFHLVGRQEAARSLAIEPDSSSAHRFLADIYGTLPRYRVARSSELLQAQLRQPLGATPLQAQLANDELFRNSFFGPETVGLNEFNPLFARDGLDFKFFGGVGSNDTYSDQVLFGGVNGAWSFSLSQVASETDGYRSNNDDSLREYDGLIQWQLAQSTSVQAEFTDSTRKSGDLSSSFDPDSFGATDRNEEIFETQRVGVRQVISPRSDVLVSLIRQDRRSSLTFPDPDAPSSIVSADDSWKAEIQLSTSLVGIDTVFGASYFEADSTLAFNFPPDSFVDNFEPRHVNAYAYAHVAVSALPLWLQIGVSYDDFSSDVGKQSELNPKFGVIWDLSEAVTLRAAAFRVLTRNINSDQGLEPTQLAGFNQLLDDTNATVSESGGLAADFRLAPALSAGLELVRRRMETPVFDELGNVVIKNQREESVGGYLYWLASDWVSVSLEPRYSDFRHGLSFDSMELLEMPISIKFMRPNGLWIGVTATHVHQSGEFDSFGGLIRGSDSFIPVDAIVAYRFPRRAGAISLEATNVFDEQFRYQEIDAGVAPRYVPESQYFLRVSLAL